MTLARLHRLAPDARPETAPIEPEKVVEGAPVATTRNQYALDDQTFVGEWSATPGAWRVAYDEWEYCRMLEGVCELIPDGGPAQRFSAGDSFVIEPGFQGLFRVIEPMTKAYVIRL